MNRRKRARRAALAREIAKKWLFKRAFERVLVDGLAALYTTDRIFHRMLASGETVAPESYDTGRWPGGRVISECIQNA